MKINVVSLKRYRLFILISKNAYFEAHIEAQYKRTFGGFVGERLECKCLGAHFCVSQT